MTDTQWPRYQVFLKQRDDDPFHDVGSVHAPDPDMALLNARDVFVRRPECSALWVVPANAITTQTLEEQQERPTSLPDTSSPVQTFHLFAKTRHTGAQTYAATFEAHSPQEALLIGRSNFPSNHPPLALWVFPVSEVIENDPSDRSSFFEPARDKPFRLSTDFHTVSAMRAIRRKLTGNPEAAAPPDEPERGAS